jgi:hypothetical protein
MAFVAQTTLYVDKGGKTLRIDEGKTVTKSSYDEDVFDQWVKDGSVVEVSKSADADDAASVEENEALKKQVADLQKALEDAKQAATKQAAAGAQK